MRRGTFEFAEHARHPRQELLVSVLPVDLPACLRESNATGHDVEFVDCSLDLLLNRGVLRRPPKIDYRQVTRAFCTLILLLQPLSSLDAS